MSSLTTNFGPFIGLLVVAALIFLLGYWTSRKIAQGKLRDTDSLIKKQLADAEKEAGNIKKSAEIESKEKYYQARLNFEKETEGRRKELEGVQRHIQERELNLDKKLEIVEKKEKEVARMSEEIVVRERVVKSKDEKLTQLISEQNSRLERIAGLSAEDAKRELIENLKEEARVEASQYVKDIKEKAKREAEKEAKQIITLAVQRCAADHVVESTVSVVNLPSDEMKGRIIGREGRNIRAFEMATGIDVIIDDTPEAVILSGFSPIRREIARLAMEKLIVDGRIHPGRIEDVVEKSRKEVEEKIQLAGEEACYETGVHGLHPEMVSLLGRLKFRTSYGQNNLQHAKEVTILCGLMAAELGLDIDLAKRAGLLHDIGKAVDHEAEGTHTQIGIELAKKYNEPAEVIDAIASHHNDIEPTTLISVLVQAADALSGARPGARRETLETYIKRLEQLEQIADGFKGVQKAYAIQAGREIRVMVQPEEVDDAYSEVMAGEIARKIEKELEYPGQIKVMVIRETRSVDYAK
ncbi:MAG: ribonuclease Y [Candidatus Glassbacteria bacterium RIFCSPLOWO2_12_FULL_58_11]|uniref:Ribonuclease Y n=2 Tax=Candidatus Glassiibacteriota TaxID=1817805 RepID=A0A1F5Z3D0_9BACT|nr:MAG: ribonuclease Y [Candidatus Glassbacteria bacterium GWA2_58_10]OGG06875.1 MAG: ribonuclease Y [Candidatus Glassbacteria bacterium RIFCSPLOWO2_12_FULL_58_11]